MDRRVALLGVAVTLVLTADASAQGRGGVQNAPPPTARVGAAFDMTGYWVSEVTEKWRYRMMVPDKNDYQMVPLNPEGRKVAAAWDPARDQAMGEACRSYGAVGLLQIPGRLHITWQDDNTLRLETDSGKQRRLLHFGGSQSANQEPSWQGSSAAMWGGGEPRDRRDGFGGPAQDATGRVAVLPAQRKEPDYLKVTTTRMRPGYLQKNGIPYSSNALLEEYFDVFTDPYSKNTWLVVTTVVTDPQYLVEPLVMHAHFKKLPDAAGWDPTECRADEPR